MPALTATPRIAGALYLVIIVTGLTAELALRGPAVTALTDGAATLADLAPRLRLAALADLLMLLADVALALVFFALLRAVSEGLALAAMVFRLMQAALIGLSLTLFAAIPGLADSAETALALHLAGLHATGYDIGLVLFGINSLIMAGLLHRAGGIPWVIAAGIGLSGLVYITGGVVRLAAPDWLALLQPAYLVPMLAETALALWLLVTGRLFRAGPRATPPYPPAAAR